MYVISESGIRDNDRDIFECKIERESIRLGTVQRAPMAAERLPWGSVRLTSGGSASRVITAASEGRAKSTSAAVRAAVAQREKASDSAVASGGIKRAPFTGTSVWEASILLAHVLDRAVSRTWWADQRVVELGAGAGLPGMAAAALGCRETVVTDQFAHLLDANLALNFPGGSGGIRAAPLTWGDTTEIASCRAGGAFDVVLCADIMVPWFDTSWSTLCDTIDALSHLSTVVLWALERRDAGDDVHLFNLMRQRGFTSIRDLSADSFILDVLPAGLRSAMRPRILGRGLGENAADSTTTEPMDETVRDACGDGLSLLCLTRGSAEVVEGMWNSTGRECTGSRL